LNFLLSTSIDSDHDECVRDVYNKGFVWVHQPHIEKLLIN
jgi:hypothetical protein